MGDKNCNRSKMAIKDTLDIVGGKWKLILISILKDGGMGFNELSREAGISPRILSKELQELEINDLVKRKVNDTKPVTVEYSLTPYSETLREVLSAMEVWGLKHRDKIISK